jgi:hypothetical protein
MTMTVCAWCSRDTDSATTVNGVAYHWTCLKRRAATLRDGVKSRRGDARATRARTAYIVQQLRQTP